MRRRVVVAGATGFVGQRLLPELRDRGFDVVGGTRNPERARHLDPTTEWVHLDVSDEHTIVSALEGADALVYLVHQMASHGDDLLADERCAAHSVLRAAENAGIRRIVYLGAPCPKGKPSRHLEARLVTGKILRSGSISTIELQSAMIIGHGSQSWLIVRDLSLRLPIMVLPQWLSRVSQPIGVGDVVDALCQSISIDRTTSLCLPLPGPESLAARDILLRIAAVRGTRPIMVPVPVLSPSLSSHWIRLVTRADYKIARQLVDGLTEDLLSGDHHFWNFVAGATPTPLDEVIQNALNDETSLTLPPWQRAWEHAVQTISLPANKMENRRPETA